jgi:hypothetical protein
MNVAVISVAVLFALGLATLRLIWPSRRRGADWRELYESAMSEKNSDVLKTIIYEAESAVQSRQKELRSAPSDSPERRELGIAETALIRLKSEKLRWPVVGA